ncbi:phage tail assembly protein [Rhizobium puerariae]|uniref:Phage tail assembly protein n=1 Tax=Rhizobium puerariae TaxID=1585791 RepID=A0ABV6AK43_9HYPH
MDQVTKAVSPQQIAEANQNAENATTRPSAKQVLPTGFEASKIIQLAVPVEHDGTTYQQVSIRRLKGRDFLKLREMAGDEDTGLLSIVTALPAAVIEELDADDFVTLSEAARDFLPQSLQQAAGQTSASGQDSVA